MQGKIAPRFLSRREVSSDESYFHLRSTVVGIFSLNGCKINKFFQKL